MKCKLSNQRLLFLFTDSETDEPLRCKGVDEVLLRFLCLLLLYFIGRISNFTSLIGLNQMKKSIIDSTYIARLTLGIAIIKYFAINRTSSKVSRKA